MAGWSGIYFQLVLQVSFLIAAVASTLLAQALSYQGAAHEHSMLIVLFEYLGMSSVWIFRAMLPGGSGEHDEVDHEHHAVPTHEDGGGGGAHSNSSSSPSSPGLGPASAAPPSPSESPFKVAATSQLRYDDADESNSSSSSSSSTASSALPAHRPDTGSSASASSQSGLADIGTNAGVALASASAHGIVTVASTAKDLIWLTSAWLGTRIAAALNLAPPRSTTTSSASSAAASSASSADAASTSSSSSASSDSAIVRLQVMRALGQDDMSSGSSSSSSSSSFSGASGSSLHWLTGCSRDCISGVVMLTVLDLAAAAFGFFGLVYAGSGAFAVVNSASLAVTAVLSRVLLKRPLSRPKTMAVCAVTGGLALAGLGALLAPAELSTAPLLLTAKGVTRLEEHSFFTGTTRIVFGILFTLFSTILYSLEYVLAEQILVAAQKDKSITSAQLCGYMGFTGSSIFLLYVLFYTIPNWNHLVTQEMIRHRASAFKFLCFSEFLFPVHV